jgi:hypothetical protein
LKIQLILITFLFAFFINAKAQIDERYLILDGSYYGSEIKEDKFTNSGHTSIVSVLNRRALGHTFSRDLEGNSRFSLKFIDEKKLKIQIFDAFGNFVSERIYRFKATDKGLLLKNRNVRFGMIPYVFGFFEIVKVWIVLDEGKNLKVEYFLHHSGGFLVLLLGDTYNDSHVIEYPPLPINLPNSN